MPLSAFSLEIEGATRRAAMAEALGFEELTTSDDHRGVFLKLREQFGIAGPDMVFDEPDAGS